MLDNEYVAGLFDTDGSVSITTSKYSVKLSCHFGGTNTIYESNGLLHEWLQNNDILVNPTKQPPSNYTKNIAYRFTLATRDSLKLFDVLGDSIKVRRVMFERCVDIVHSSKQQRNRFEYFRYRYENEYTPIRFTPTSDFSKYDMSKHPSYLSGIFDGDGRVTSRIRSGRNNPDVKIDITNWDVNMLKSVQSVFGGHLSQNKGNDVSWCLSFRSSEKFNYESWNFALFLLDYGCCNEKYDGLIEAKYHLEQRGYYPKT